MFTLGQYHIRCINVPASPQPCQHTWERDLSIFFNLLGVIYALCKCVRILYLTHLDKAVVFLASVSYFALLRGMPKSCSHLCWIEDRLSKDAVVNNSYNLDTVLLPDAISLSFLSRSKSCTMCRFEISNPKMDFNYIHAKKSRSHILKVVRPK